MMIVVDWVKQNPVVVVIPGQAVKKVAVVVVVNGQVTVVVVVQIINGMCLIQHQHLNLVIKIMTIHGLVVKK